MSKIVSDPRLPTVNDEKIRPLTQRLYELFRQYAIAHNKSYMWDTEGTAAPTTGTWSVSQMCKNTSPTTGIIGWVCIASGTPGTWSTIQTSTGTSSAYPASAKGNSTSISTNTLTVLTLDTVVFDPESLINLTADRIVVPVDGYYQVNAIAAYTTVIQASLCVVHILLDGVSQRNAGSAAYNTNVYPVCMCSGLIYATKDQYFQVATKHNATGTINDVQGEIDIHLVSL